MEKQLTKKEVEISLLLDPSQDEVLGVFGSKVHILSHFHQEVEGNLEGVSCVLVVPETEYLRVWQNWLKGKQRYCEQWNEYCGVMGYTFAKDYKEIDIINVPTFNPEADDDNEDTWFTIEVPTRAFEVTRFEDTCDFEHG